MDQPLLVGPNGKPVQSERLAPCPKCGRSATERIPSSGFGIAHWICPCGYDFEGRLTCQPIIP